MELLPRFCLASSMFLTVSWHVLCVTAKPAVGSSSTVAAGQPSCRLMAQRISAGAVRALRKCCHGSASCVSCRQCCRSLHASCRAPTVMTSWRWPGALCGTSQVSQRRPTFCLHSFTLCQSVTLLFTDTCTHLFTCTVTLSPVHLHTHLLIYLHTYSFIYTLIHLHIHSLVHLHTHSHSFIFMLIHLHTLSHVHILSLTHSRVHLQTHSLTCSLTHSLSHLLAHSLIKICSLALTYTLTLTYTFT